MNKIGKLRCYEAKKYEFEGLEIKNVGKSRCEEENAATRAQRSGPFFAII